MAKEKTPCKNGKTGKFAEEQDNASKDSFQNNEAIANVFYIKAYIKKRKPQCYHYVWKILVWRRPLWSKSGRQRGASPVSVAFTKEVFYILDRMVLFLSS